VSSPLINPFPDFPNPAIILSCIFEGQVMAALVVLLLGGASRCLNGGRVGKMTRATIDPNIVVGILGSIVAGFVFPLLGVHLGSGLVGSVIHAAIGAIIFLFVLSLIRRA